jgi:hypothetical protein
MTPALHLSVATEHSYRAQGGANVNSPDNKQQSDGQTRQRAMSTGDAETISKTIDETEGGNR